MIRYRLYTIFLAVIFVPSFVFVFALPFFIPTAAYAETGVVTASATVPATAPATTTINARILPTVWYSSLNVNDKDSIKIYAGIQNNSEVTFNGVAIFFVDGTALASTTYISIPDSLKDVSVDWVAQGGDHEVKVSISANLPTTSASRTPVVYALVSNTTDISKITVVRHITVAVVADAVGQTLLSAVKTIDAATASLADDILSMKSTSTGVHVNTSTTTNTAASAGNVAAEVAKKQKGSVLGTTTKSDTSNDVATGNTDVVMKSLFNIALDVLAFLVRNWKWTIVGIVIILVALRVTRRGGPAPVF